MSDCRLVNKSILKKEEAYAEIVNDSKFPYCEVVGAIMYLMMRIRLDPAYTINILSCKLKSPSKEGLIKVKRAFRCVANSKATVYKSGYKSGVLEKL